MKRTRNDPRSINTFQHEHFRLFAFFINRTKAYIVFRKGPRSKDRCQVGNSTGGSRIQTRILHVQTSRPNPFDHRQSIFHARTGVNHTTQYMVTQMVILTKTRAAIRIPPRMTLEFLIRQTDISKTAMKREGLNVSQ